MSGREIMAGGVQGFVDGSFEAPLGRLCGGLNGMAFADGRLYFSDQSNDAVRYLAVND